MSAKCLSLFSSLPFPAGAANASISPSVLSWHLIAFGLVMGLLLAVDTVLYFSVKRDLRSSLNTRKDYTFGWSKDILDK